LEEKPLENGRPGRDVGWIRRATQEQRIQAQDGSCVLGTRRQLAEYPGRLDWRSSSKLQDLPSDCITSNTGHCGGVDPLRSAKSNGVRRAGYGGAPATPGVFVPIGVSEEKNKRERENEKRKLSRMSTIGTDGHFIREPLGTSWL
jgi:hypothetical protein